MNTKTAIETLRDIVLNCDQQTFADIVIILELGAGTVFLTGPEDRRKSVIAELVDSIHFSTCGDEDEYRPEAEFVPCYMGAWELVLASLILDQNWHRIFVCAQELRKEHAEEN